MKAPLGQATPDYHDRTRAWLEQAEAFYRAAELRANPARPLLFYYSFLNLAKTYVEWSGVSLPNKVTHGIADPRTNSAAPPDLAGQVVSWNGRAGDHSEIFAEYLELVRKGRPLSLASGTPVPVLDLFADVPVIHRTFQTIEHTPGDASSFIPFESLGPAYDKTHAWLKATFRHTDREVLDSEVELRSDLYWNEHFEQVSRGREDEIAYESRSTEPWSSRWMDQSLQRLSEEFRTAVPHGVIVTGSAYRYYLQLRPQAFPPMAAMYALMFYLGSVTRYRPHHFRALEEGRHGWLISEALTTVPPQFLYLLASDMAGVEVLPAPAVRE